MVNSKDPEVRARGVKLKADYERLKNDHSVTFHVRNESADDNGGELSYEGQKGHLYINIKGDSSAFGSLTLIQKLAHEFKHGNQFLDGELGFFKTKNGKWTAFANDLHDESEAMIAGFEADPISATQTTNTNNNKANNVSFMNALDEAVPKGQKAVIEVMKTNGGSPYTKYNTTRGRMTNIPNSEDYYYVVPKTK
ncbi:MAG: hypothetical protein IPJ30_19125 [Acidobacteria bacterium]|nr:hypothetical protein [Acidobacteriota bacterium]